MSLKEDLQSKYNLNKEEVESLFLEIGIEPKNEDFSQQDSQKILESFEEKYQVNQPLNLAPIVEKTALISKKVKESVVEDLAQRAIDKKNTLKEDLFEYLEFRIDSEVINACETGEVIKIFEIKSNEMKNSPKKPSRLLPQLKQLESRLLPGENSQRSLPFSENSSDI